MDTLHQLMDFISRSPSPYHAVASAAALLEGAGFARLEECASWTLEWGKGYYTTRNQSSLIAFRLPKTALSGWRMTAAHSDSPTFYIKGDVLEGDKRYLRLSAEGYGGMNCASWLDRPLTVAGRAIVKTAQGVESRLVYLDRDLLTIPSLAIHQQRDVNRGHDYNAQKDMQPLYGLAGSPSLCWAPPGSCSRPPALTIWAAPTPPWRACSPLRPRTSWARSTVSLTTRRWAAALVRGPSAPSCPTYSPALPMY